MAVLSMVAGFSLVGPSVAQVTLGLNKTELVQQYLGTASGGDGGVGYRQVGMAMARKAMADAQDVGARFLRVSITGTFPVKPGQKGDLDLWRADPRQYWQRVDVMMDDLRGHELKLVPVFVWNVSQIPNIQGASLGSLIKQADSPSWRLLQAYVTDFITRYRDSGLIQFYELTNELNNAADVNVEKICAQGATNLICAGAENFTAEDMIAFTGRFSRLIRSLDPQARISSGFTIPRPNAQALRDGSAGSRAKRGAASLDSIEDLEQYLAATHQYVDIISVHLYPLEKNRRWGMAKGEEYKLLRVVQRIAERLGKPLFVGEFGDFDTPAAGPGSFTDRMLNDIIHLDVPYAALWGWEFYIRNPRELQARSCGDDASRECTVAVEPGRTDYVVQRFSQAAAQASGQMKARRQREDAPPRVVISWPLDCSRISDGEKVYALASDIRDGISQVSFWLDDRLIARDDSWPYAADLAVAGVASGDHVLRAVAEDTKGRTTEYRVTVGVGKPPAAADCSVR